MSFALQRSWTAEQFLAWNAVQEIRYEFDGIRPVAMTGGNANHNRITNNIHAVLRTCLRGTPCSNYGPDLGIETINPKIRFPDVLITCTKFPGISKIAPAPVIVFEVLSPTSGGIDRIEKLGEYQAVTSILRYIIVESATIGFQVLHRVSGSDPWSVFAIGAKGLILALPEVGADLSVAEIYEDVDFSNETMDR